MQARRPVRIRAVQFHRERETMKVKVRCPTEGAEDEHGVGCGLVFEDEPDHEGLMDCGGCGLFFRHDDPHAQAPSANPGGAR